MCSSMMAAPQPDHTSAIQDFHQWTYSQDAQREGRRGSDNTAVTKFIPLIALEEKLTKRTIETLLKELFQDPDQPAPNAERVRIHRLRCFAILLSAGSGHMIQHFIQYHCLQDNALPFSSEPKDFPKSATLDLFQAFNEKQWQFCPFRFEYDMDEILEDSYILPIARGDKLGEGGSANLYKFVIDPDYNGLLESEQRNTAATRPNSNVFALKSYRTPEARSYFKTERNALTRLRYDNMPHSNIIACYGSFVRNDTFNTILEYADRGTLGEYMAAMHEPTSPSDILSFYEHILGVLKGLVHIHGSRADGAGEPGKLLGWHQDISPDNILVVSRSPDNPYDCDFKIADLGLAHFKQHVSSFHDPTDEDRYTSNSYGAPETYRTPNLERSHLRVTQSVDIWSMGCVFSEVVTWVAEGSEKLQEYRRRRKLEILDKAKTDTGEALFHHDWKVLDAVQQIHEDIILNSRKNDHVTPSVVQKLIEGMMMVDPGSRPTAQYFHTQSSIILGNAQNRLAGQTSRSLATSSNYTTSGEAIAARRPRLPPNLPPGHHGLGVVEPIEVESDASSLEQALRPRPSSSAHVSERSVTTTPQGSIAQRPFHTPSRRNGGNGVDESLDYEDGQYRQPHSSARRPERNLSYPMPPSTQSQSQMDSMANWGLTAHPSPQQNASRIPPNIFNNKHSPQYNTTLPLREHGNAHFTFGAATQGPYTIERTHRGSSYDDSDTFVPSTSATFGSPHLPSHSIAEPSNHTRTSRNERPHPEMSVEAGLQAKRKRDKGQYASYPGRDQVYQTLDAILSKRDHAFLVDSAVSMSPHWEKVRKALELLWALTERYDPDGLDLYFSTETRKHRPKTNKKMLKIFDDRSAQGCPDMRHRFASIIESYQSRFGKKNTLSKFLHPNSTPDKGPRALTLYVLTDGVWQPHCTLVTEIKNLVTSLRQHGMPNKHIGIQFICFGSDERGKKRLRNLDSELGLELDIVDTTSADGNVWKMLLGPVNDWFDDDDHDEDTNGHGP